ncbi:cytochrome P450 [Xylogone sp. PMI_703]|nr:cytochrome P450 [Xylogone sp. PMI_703]
MFSFSITVLASIAAALLLCYRYLIFPAFVSPLAKIPNAHWSSPISPFWILFTRYHWRENREVHAAHLKHGPVVRLGPTEISVNDVGGLRTIYAGGFEKGQWYSIFDNYGVPCMFSTWHSNTHSLRKRFISHVYSKSSIQGSPAVHRHSQVILYDRLFPIISAAATASPAPTTVDVLDLWNGTTMDFVTAYLFGLKNSSNFLQDEPYRKHWLELYQGRKKYTFFPQELPRLTGFLKSLGIRLVPAWVDDANRELEAWTKSRCASTMAYLETQAASDPDPANVPSVVNALLAGIEKEKGNKGADSILQTTTLSFPELSVASEMIDHLAAGHETSGITLTYLSWHLSQDLQLQARLREELLTLAPNFLLDSENKSSEKPVPDPKQLDKLPLLHAAVMETLRLESPIPGGQPRMTPYPSCIIGPYQVPGGIRVESQAYSLHRNEDVFPEPEKWDYRRWLDEKGQGGLDMTEEQRKERDRCFWAFSSGGRMCVGSNFAMHQIKLVAAAVYTNFTTHIVNDDGIEQTDGYTCGPTGNKLLLRFKRVPPPS